MSRAQQNHHSPMKEGRYQPVATIGTGTYGHVVKCLDRSTGTNVAIKIAHREPAYRRSALNEARVLGLLSNSPDVVTPLDTFEDDGRVCIAVEMLHKNLYEVMRDRDFRPVDLHDVRAVTGVLLRSLSALHREGYMHCDVKPENVMMKGPNSDFGDSCLIDFGAVRKFSENMYYDIQSLWYRAPEVLCGIPYSPAIDSWSVGCLLYELHTGTPLFPGDGPQDQVSHIIETFGMPSQEAMTSGKNSNTLHFTSLFPPGTKSIDGNIISEDSVLRDQFIELLHLLLMPDEHRRISCTDALRHPFVTGSPPPARLVSNTSLCSNNSTVGPVDGVDIGGGSLSNISPYFTPQYSFHDQYVQPSFAMCPPAIGTSPNMKPFQGYQHPQPIIAGPLQPPIPPMPVFMPQIVHQPYMQQQVQYPVFGAPMMQQQQLQHQQQQQQQQQQLQHQQQLQQQQLYFMHTSSPYKNGQRSASSSFSGSSSSSVLSQGQAPTPIGV